MSLAGLGLLADSDRPWVEVVMPLAEMGQVTAKPPLLVAAQVQSQTVVGPPSPAGLGGGLRGIDDGQASSASAARGTGFFLLATMPLSPVTLEVATLASQPALHVSTLPSSPTIPAFKADFVTPTRRSGRYGAAVDGASTTNDDSLQRAMCRKANLTSITQV
jgi:hypothetical protein